MALPKGTRIQPGAPKSEPVKSPQPTTPLPSSRPARALQPFGVHVGIEQVNDRVQRLTDAHERRFGTRPKPGLVMDVLRVDFDGDYDELFSHVPRSKRQARLVPIAGGFGANLEAGLGSDQEILSEARAAAEEGRLPEYLAENGEAIASLARNPRFAPEIAKLSAVSVAARFEQGEQAVQSFRAKELHAAGMGDLVPIALVVGPLAIKQITEVAIDLPYGLYKLGESVSKDIGAATPERLLDLKDADKRKELDFSFKRSREIAMAMKDQIIEDFRHPLRNPGYLALDIWAIVTIGAGGVARGSAAARAAKSASREGAKKRHVARYAAGTFLKRPVPVTYELGLETYNASIPLFENAAARGIQTWLLNKRQKAIVERRTEGFEGRHTWLYDELFSTERKIARERQINFGIEYGIMTAPLLEYTRMARWDARAKAVIGDLLSDPRTIRDFKRLRTKQKIGIEKALQVMLTDDPTPFRAWEALHRREIASARRQISDLSEQAGGPVRRSIRALEHQLNSHKVQLEALRVAKEMIANPPKRWAPLFEATQKVSRGQQRLKELHLGLDYDIAEQAIAKLGALVRAEELVELGGGKLGVVPEGLGPVQPLLQKIQKQEDALQRARKKLSEAQGALRLHPGREDLVARAEGAQALVDRRNRALGRSQQTLEDIKESSLPLERQTESSAYFPIEREMYAKGGILPGPSFRSRRSKFGLGPPENLPNLRYKLTGKALEIGDFRWDTSALLTEQYIKATKAAFTFIQHRDLWESGAKKPMSHYDMPIRDVRNAPERLKQVVAALENKFISPEKAEILTEKALKDLREWAAPSREAIEKMLKSGDVKASEIRWVDERFIFDRVAGQDIHFWRQMDRVFSGFFSAPNEVMRLALVFLTPAYFLNAGGSGLALIAHQGPLAVPNVVKAVRARSIYGPDAARIFDSLAGETFGAALTTERNVVTALSQAVMKSWSQVTDKMLRRAAVIGELEKRGIINPRMGHDEVLAALNSEVNKKSVVESARRSRQAMLDFSRMSWPERATMRHLLFLYGFLRASAVWGPRFLLEHPIQADVLGQAGRDRKEDLEEALDGQQPEWFLRHGYFPVAKGWVFDPIQFNMAGMMVEMAYTGASLFADVPYSSPADMLGPGVKLAHRMATGRDEQGRELEGPGGSVPNSFLSMLRETPWGYAIAREERESEEEPLPSPPVESGALDPIEAAMARESAALDHGTFEADSWLQTWGRTIFRSALPYEVEKEAANARYWRDLRDTDPEAFVRHQLDKVNEMIARQEKVIGREAPFDVREAVDLVFKISVHIEKWKQENDLSEPSDKMLAIEYVNVLLEEEKISKEKATELRSWVNEARTPREAKERRLSILWNNGGRAWKNWTGRVTEIHWFSEAEYPAAIQDGAREGVGDYGRSTKASEETKWAYGRSFYAFLEEYDERQAQNRRLDGEAKKAADAELRLWLQGQDQPVRMDGVSFPSFERMRHMKKSPEERKNAVRSMATKSWELLTSAEKEILGRKVGPNAANGWLTLRDWLRQQKEALGDKDLPTGIEAFYVREIRKSNPDFGKDWDFSREILAERMKFMRHVQRSKYASDWRELLSRVTTDHKVLTEAGYPPTPLANYWVRENLPVHMAWLRTKSRGFQTEVQTYSESNPKFLEGLVRR